MMNKVYIVIGSSGAHEQYETWQVCCYPDQEIAEQHCRLAQQQYEKTSKEEKEKESGTIIYFKTSFDPHEIYYLDNHIKYNVVECMFTRHVDEYLDLIQE